MSTQFRAFRPLAPSQNVVTTTSAQTINLNYRLGTTAARVCVVGTDPVFFEINDAQSSKVANAATSVMVPAGNTEVFILGNGALSLSVIGLAGGSTFYVVQGEGL